ncbi:hypothetical protein K9N50_03355 [bacterium]|nr:hypothetical protein [bacterium]
MKVKKHLILKILTTTILLISTSLQAYQIDLEFLSGNPMVFPIGSFIQGNMSDVKDIDFNDFEPFFTIEVIADDNDAPNEELYLLIQMQAQDGANLFTVVSAQFDIDQILGRSINNQALGYDPIYIGTRGNTQMGARQLMTNYLNGQELREGFYTLSVVLSDVSRWEDAIQADHKRGMISKSINVYNLNQVDLIEPMDGTIINENPTFIWSFPAEEGVTFRVEVVNADPDEEPVNAIEFASGQSVYADFYMKPAQWQLGGNLTSYSYTGNKTGVEEIRDFVALKQLEKGKTYFWRITAKAPTMFPGEFSEYRSSVYSFNYSGSTSNASGGRGDPNLLGGSGEENPTPDREQAVFNILRQYLTEEQITTLSSLLGDFRSWNLQNIRIGGRQVTAAELARNFSEGNITILTVSVSE